MRAGSSIKIPPLISGRVRRIIFSSTFGAHCEFGHICNWQVFGYFKAGKEKILIVQIWTSLSFREILGSFTFVLCALC